MENDCILVILIKGTQTSLQKRNPVTVSDVVIWDLNVPSRPHLFVLSSLSLVSNYFRDSIKRGSCTESIALKMATRFHEVPVRTSITISSPRPLCVARREKKKKEFLHFHVEEEQLVEQLWIHRPKM